GAHLVVGPRGHALEEPAAEGVPYACRIDDARWGHRGDVGPPFGFHDCAASFTSSDDERLRMAEHAHLVQACLLANQLELVVVADDHGGAHKPVLEFVARHP